MIAVILFDVGGVLVELAGVEQMMTWTQHRYSVEELWDKWLSSPTVRDFESGSTDPKTFADRLVSEFQLATQPEDLISTFDGWIAGPFDGAVQLLGRLRGCYRLGTLSNTNERHWPRFLDEMGMRCLFDCHFPSHETGRLKPDLDTFRYVVAELNTEANKILFLDDNQVNVEAARAAGLRAERVIGVNGAETCLASLGLT